MVITFSSTYLSMIDKPNHIFDPMFKVLIRESTNQLKSELSRLKLLCESTNDTLECIHRFDSNEYSLGDLVESLRCFKELTHWSPIKALSYIEHEYKTNMYPLGTLKIYIKSNSNEIYLNGFSNEPVEDALINVLLPADINEVGYVYRSIIDSSFTLESLINVPIRSWLDLLYEYSSKTYKGNGSNDFLQSLSFINQLSYSWDQLKHASNDTHNSSSKSVVDEDTLAEIYSGNYQLVSSNEPQSDSSKPSDKVTDIQSFRELDEDCKRRVNHFLDSHYQQLTRSIKKHVSNVFNVMSSVTSTKFNEEYNKTCKHSVYSSSDPVKDMYKKVERCFKAYDISNVSVGMDAIVHGYIPLLKSFTKQVDNDKLNNMSYNNTLNVVSIGNRLKDVRRSYVNDVVNNNVNNTLTGGDRLGLRDVDDIYKPKSSTGTYLTSLRDLQVKFNTAYVSNYKTIINKLESISQSQLSSVDSTSLPSIINDLDRVLISSNLTTSSISGVDTTRDNSKAYSDICKRLQSKCSRVSSFKSLIEPLKNIITLIDKTSNESKNIRYTYMKSTKDASEMLINSDNISVFKVPCELSREDFIRKSDIINRLYIMSQDRTIDGRSGVSTKKVLEDYISNINDRNKVINDYFNAYISSIKSSLASMNQIKLAALKKPITMKLVMVEERRKSYIWINEVLDKFLVKNRIDQLDSNVLNKNTIEDLLSVFNELSKCNQTVANRVLKEYSNLTYNDRMSYFKVYRHVKKLYEELGMLDYITKLYTHLKLVPNGFNINDFKSKLLGYLCNDLIWFDIYERDPNTNSYHVISYPNSISTDILNLDRLIAQNNVYGTNGTYAAVLASQITDSNGSSYGFTYNDLINDWKKTIECNYKTDFFAYASRITDKYNTNEYPDELRVAASQGNQSSFNRPLQNPLGQAIVDANVSDSTNYANALLHIANASLPRQQCNTVIDFDRNKEEYIKYFVGYSFNKATNSLGIFNDFYKYVIESLYTPIVQVVDKYVNQRYTGTLDISTNVNALMQGGSIDSYKEQGGSVFDFIEPHTLMNTVIKPELVPFYISAYKIIKYYNDNYSEGSSTLKLKISKISLLSGLVDKDNEYRFDITDFNKFIKLMNEYYEVVHETDSKQHLVKAIELIITELNSMLIFNDEDTILLSQGSLSDTRLTMLTTSFEDVKRSIQSVVNSTLLTSVRRGLDTTSYIDNYFNKMIDKINKTPMRQRMSVLKSILLEDTIKDTTSFKSFVDMCISPLHIVTEYYNTLLKSITSPINKDLVKVVFNTTTSDKTIGGVFKEFVSRFIRDLNEVLDTFASFPGMSDESIHTFINTFKTSVVDAINKLRLDERLANEPVMKLNKVVVPYVKLNNSSLTFNTPLDKLEGDGRDVINKYPYVTVKVDTYRSNTTTFTEFVMALLSTASPKKYLPKVFTEVLSNSQLVNNTLELTKSVKSSTRYATAMMTNSTTQEAYDATDISSITELLATRYVSIIPFILEVLNRFYYSFEDGLTYEVSLDNRKERINPKLEITILMNALKRTYTTLLPYSSNTQFMSCGSDGLHHCISELRGLNELNLINVFTSSPDKFEWMYIPVSNDLGLSYSDYDRLEDYRKTFNQVSNDSALNTQLDNVISITSELLMDLLLMSLNTVSYESVNKNMIGGVIKTSNSIFNDTLNSVGIHDHDTKSLIGFGNGYSNEELNEVFTTGFGNEIIRDAYRGKNLVNTINTLLINRRSSNKCNVDNNIISSILCNKANTRNFNVTIPMFIAGYQLGLIEPLLSKYGKYGIKLINSFDNNTYWKQDANSPYSSIVNVMLNTAGYDGNVANGYNQNLLMQSQYLETKSITNGGIKRYNSNDCKLYRIEHYDTSYTATNILISPVTIGNIDNGLSTTTGLLPEYQDVLDSYGGVYGLLNNIYDDVVNNKYIDVIANHTQLRDNQSQQYTDFVNKYHIDNRLPIVSHSEDNLNNPVNHITNYNDQNARIESLHKNAVKGIINKEAYRVGTGLMLVFDIAFGTGSSRTMYNRSSDPAIALKALSILYKIVVLNHELITDDNRIFIHELFNHSNYDTTAQQPTPTFHSYFDINIANNSMLYNTLNRCITRFRYLLGLIHTAEHTQPAQQNHDIAANIIDGVGFYHMTNVVNKVDDYTNVVDKLILDIITRLDMYINEANRLRSYYQSTGLLTNDTRFILLVDAIRDLIKDSNIELVNSRLESNKNDPLTLISCLPYDANGNDDILMYHGSNSITNNMSNRTVINTSNVFKHTYYCKSPFDNMLEWYNDTNNGTSFKKCINNGRLDTLVHVYVSEVLNKASKDSNTDVKINSSLLYYINPIHTEKLSDKNIRSIPVIIRTNNCNFCELQSDLTTNYNIDTNANIDSVINRGILNTDLHNLSVAQQAQQAQLQQNRNNYIASVANYTTRCSYDNGTPLSTIIDNMNYYNIYCNVYNTIRQAQGTQYYVLVHGTSHIDLTNTYTSSIRSDSSLLFNDLTTLLQGIAGQWINSSSNYLINTILTARFYSGNNFVKGPVVGNNQNFDDNALHNILIGNTVHINNQTVSNDTNTDEFVSKVRSLSLLTVFNEARGCESSDDQLVTASIRSNMFLQDHSMNSVIDITYEDTNTVTKYSNGICTPIHIVSDPMNILVNKGFDSLNDTITRSLESSLKSLNGYSVSGFSFMGGDLLGDDSETTLKKYSNSTLDEELKKFFNQGRDQSITSMLITYFNKPLLSFNNYFNRNIFVEVMYNSALFNSSMKKLSKVFYKSLVEGDNKKLLTVLLNTTNTSDAYENDTNDSTLITSLETIKGFYDNQYNPNNNHNEDVLDTVGAYNSVNQPTTYRDYINKKYERDIIDNNNNQAHRRIYLDAFDKTLLKVDSCNSIVSTLLNVIKSMSYFNVSDLSNDSYNGYVYNGNPYN